MTNVAHSTTSIAGGHTSATSSVAGFMSAADKALLDQFFSDLGVSAIVETDDFDCGGALTSGSGTLTTGTVFGKGNWRVSLTNSGSLKLVQTLQDATHRGILQMETTTSTSSTSGFIDDTSSGGHTVLGTGQQFLIRALVRVEDLSDGTNRYTQEIGWLGSLASVPTDAAMFIYSDNINSGNWTGRALKASASTDASGGSNVPVVADTWYLLDIIWDGTTMTFKVNNTTIGTIAAADIPTATLGIGALQFRSIGTAPRLTYIDLIGRKLVWGTPRAP